jgi:integrase
LSNLPHIHRRVGGVWYFERRVPLDVILSVDAWQRVFGGKKLWRKSLRTRNLIDAVERYYDVATEFEAFLADARGAIAAPTVLAHAQPQETSVLTTDEYTALGYREHKIITSGWSQLSAKSNVSAKFAEKFEADSAEYMANRPRRLEQIRNRNLRSVSGADWPLPFSRASEINVENGYNMSLESNRFGVLVGVIRGAMLRADADIVEIINGSLTSPSSASPVARDAAKINRALARRTPTISETVKTYVDAGGSNNKLAVRTKNGMHQALDEFVAAVGDKQLHHITRADVQRFLQLEGAKSVGGKTPSSIKRPMSPATVKKKMTFLRSAVAMAIDRENFEDANPFATVKVAGYVKAVNKAVTPDKRAFSLSELRTLLSHPWFVGCEDTSDRGSLRPGAHRLNDARFWGPILALYTGCRVGELGGLRLSEVFLDDDHPHIQIQPNRYRGIKNNKPRTVPILDALRSLGFDQYLRTVLATGADRVFPDWSPPKRISLDGDSDALWSSSKWPKAFNRTILPAALKGTLDPDMRRPVTLHSFRGSFKRLLEDSDIPKHYVDDIIGHAKSEIDQRYSGTRSIDFLSDRTRMLEYKNLSITTPVKKNP